MGDILQHHHLYTHMISRPPRKTCITTEDGQEKWRVTESLKLIQRVWQERKDCESESCEASNESSNNNDIAYGVDFAHLKAGREL